MVEKFSPPPNFPLAAALFEASLAVVAVALGWLLARPPLETLHGNFSALGTGALATLPLVALLILCAWLPLRPFSDILEVVDDMLEPLFHDCSLVEMAVISVLAGVGEELLFRAVVQASLADWITHPVTGWRLSAPVAGWLAALLVAVLFGLMHAVNFSYALLAGLIGFYLGWLWMATGDIAVPITAHALYDFLAMLYVVKIRKQP